MNARWCVMVALALAIGCEKSRRESPAGEARSAPTVGVAATPAVPSATESPRSQDAWQGSYRSAPGSLYIPADWKDVHWKVKENGSGIGEGTIALRVDPLTHRVQGTLEGPLGPATIDGVAWDGKLAGTIVRKDPGDQGFMGTLIGTVGGDRAEGTMNVSLAEASAVRTATFAMSPQSASPRP